MKRYLSLLICVITFAVMISGCKYNNKMYEHLSNPINYQQYVVSIVNISYRDENDALHNDYDSEAIREAECVLLEVRFYSKEELAPFYGMDEQSLEKDCAEYSVVLNINSENNRILLENGFYGVVKEGTDVTLKASNWIYMDGNYFYVSSVTYNGVEYLEESLGLSNIIESMNENRGIF